MTPTCPYCSSAIAADDSNRCFCTVCGTAHHQDCWQENGGCTVFGCAAAPPEEPKLTVGAEELSATPQPAPPPPPASNPVPPPPPPVPPRPVSFTLGGYVPPAVAANPAPVPYLAPPKSRVGFIILGIFLGAFGAHNFYAGYTGRGIAQLAITLCTLFFGSIISWVWAIVEICTVEKDSRNIYMV